MNKVTIKRIDNDFETLINLNGNKTKKFEEDIKYLKKENKRLNKIISEYKFFYSKIFEKEYL